MNPFKPAPKGADVATEAGEAAGDAAVAPASRARIVERDVEAPEVFSVDEAGLWDGRPSLGGVWVAHPTVKDPERVIIRNPANGKFVIGALFRRERENPGPKLQLSSDAAAALDILAGAPTKLSVVALRREEAAPAPPLVSDPVIASAAPGTAADSATAKTAAAAIGGEAIEATAIDGAASPAEAAPKTPKERRAEARAARAAARQAKADAKAAAAAGTTAPPPPAEGSAEATAAATMAALGATEGAAPAAPAKAPTPPPAPPKPAPGSKLYAQIGIFSVEANAKRAADQMTKAGIPAQVHKGETQGKAFWRVVAGPAADAGAREALLKKIKGLGYTDAYPVSK